MFDIDAGGTEPALAPAKPRRRSKLPDAVDSARRSPKSLDAAENVALHKRLMALYVRELAKQADNRMQQSRDEDFFDHEQWDEKDRATLEARGQVPIVYNVIAGTLNWITGTEKRSRTDFKILPRRKGDSKPAERKSQLLKYLADVNGSSFVKSDAFEDATKVGIGWLEVGVQDEDDGEPVYVAHESWRNMLWDSASTKRDLSDCRFVSRTKWVDVDIAKAIFPKRAALIAESAVKREDDIGDMINGDAAMDAREVMDDVFGAGVETEFNYNRERVRLIEVWFRTPTEVSRLRGGGFSGQAYDEGHEGHAASLESGEAEVVLRTMMRMHVAIMTSKGLLHISESPYRHNDYPFTPIWCYRRGKTNLPYGVIRGLRDLQQHVNKSASKALHILSTSKTVMDKGAVDDLEDFAEEVSRPDAIIVKNPGKDLKIDADRDLAPAHMELMSRAIQMIQSVSGVTDENMGRKTNATSGVAIQARQNQGSLATANIFDNLRLAVQKHGEKELAMVEQYFSEAKSFRITNMRGTPEYVDINDGLPENSITRTKADFIISEADWRMTVRQAQTEELMALLGQLAPVAPQIALVMIDLIVESMDIANRDELVNRIRQVTGMRDPDAEEPTPQEQQRAKEAQMQKEMQIAMVQAQIAEKQASAASKQAQVERMKAEIDKIAAGVAGTNVASQAAALKAALDAITAPAAVPVADGFLHEAGFRSRSEGEDDAKRQAAIEKAAQEQEAEAQAMAQQQAMAEQQAAAQQQAQGDQPPGAQQNPQQTQPQPAPQAMGLVPNGGQ